MDPVEEAIVYKSADISETFGIDWRKHIVEVWRPGHEYLVGTIVRPPIINGHYYEAMNGELSSQLKPDFPPADGETVQDGSMRWTARLPSSPTLVAIQSNVWTLDPGIVEDSTEIRRFQALVTVSGGTPGARYRMSNVITKSNGVQEQDSLILEILDPKPV